MSGLTLGVLLAMLDNLILSTALPTIVHGPHGVLTGGALLAPPNYGERYSDHSQGDRSP